MLKAKWDIRNDVFLALFLVGIVLAFESVTAMMLTAQPAKLSSVTNIMLWGYSLLKLTAGLFAMGVGLAPWVTKNKRR